jgi:hypothetical protein
MKRLLTSLFACFSVFRVVGQDLPAAAGVSNNILGHTAFVEAFDVNGKPLTEVNKKVAGSSVLNENWGMGEVRFRNGFTFKNVELQFDLFSNELHFRKDGVGYSFIDPVKEFSMAYSENDLLVPVTFRAGYPGIKKNTENTFYKMVTAGNHFHLLNFVTRQIREQYEYTGPIKHSYQAENAFFVYDVKAGTMKAINPGKSPLLKAFPSYANAIRSFSEEKNYKLKSEAELDELFQHLNGMSLH